MKELVGLFVEILPALLLVIGSAAAIILLIIFSYLIWMKLDNWREGEGSK